MTQLVDGEEWLGPMDGDGHLQLLVMAYPGYYDFHLLDREQNLLVSLYGYAQRVAIVQAPDGSAGLQVGNARVTLPAGGLVEALAQRIGVRPQMLGD